MLATSTRGTTMIRKALIPTLAAALAVLVGGCATGYQYRGGNGDYYYGQPSIEYRDYGYGSYGYGYPGGWSGSLGFGYGYGGYPYYGYGYPYYGGYGYPYYYRHHYPRRPPVIVVQPGSTGNDGRPGHGVGDNGGGDHRPRPPWRNPVDLRQPPTPRGVVTAPVVAPPSNRGVVDRRPQRVETPRTRAPVRVERDRDERRISRP
jgi:hypothetical protein